MSIRPCEARSQFQIVIPPHSRLAWSLYVLPGRITPSSIPAASVTILKTDPGSYCSLMAALRNRRGLSTS